MVRVREFWVARSIRSPHACGDGPSFKPRPLLHLWFSPRVWGWSEPTAIAAGIAFVLPTRVGMVRPTRTGTPPGSCSPHACGDGPFVFHRVFVPDPFSPRVWGWSAADPGRGQLDPVLPTRVGMVHNAADNIIPIPRSPHACGDGPRNRRYADSDSPFSPRVWGWSEWRPGETFPGLVLPTRVGMVRRTAPCSSRRTSSPHACGDGPCSMEPPGSWATFSPRVWGWSEARTYLRNRRAVLPTRVGMVRCSCRGRAWLWRSPHACGDGPDSIGSWLQLRRFSPRVWGWSAARRTADPGGAVLPTRVGMVRASGRPWPGGRRSPHACGDGPYRPGPSKRFASFSPRVWGWSDYFAEPVGWYLVLPTRVGMVRAPRWLARLSGGSPHACGDGPTPDLPRAGPLPFSPRVWGWSEAPRRR